MGPEHEGLGHLHRLQGTAPREGDARAAVAVVVDDSGPGLGLEPDVAPPKRPQAYPGLGAQAGA